MSGPRSGQRQALVIDVVIVLVSFAAAALVAGVLWPQLVDPVRVEVTEAGLLTDEVALGERFDVIGWYSLLGGGFGLLLGAVLVGLRRNHEVVTVLAVLVAACLAALLSARVGTWVGPDAPAQVLADKPVGATAEDRVVLTAEVAYLVWPISALAGALAGLLGRSDEGRSRHGST